MRSSSDDCVVIWGMERQISEVGEVTFGVALTPVQVGFDERRVKVGPMGERTGSDCTRDARRDVADHEVDLPAYPQSQDVCGPNVVRSGVDFASGSVDHGAH